MIISTVDELRLFFPTNAIDNLESLTGFIGSSESDFLKDKLGDKLYRSMVDFYNSTIRNHVDEYIDAIQNNKELPYYKRLIFISQKAVAFDALSRSINIQAISVNGAGVNVASADDYKAADAQSIADFKKACVKEAHSAINEVLQILEDWAMIVSSGNYDPDGQYEMGEIVDLWKHSRYFYLAASLIIPSAVVLQEYYNIYESREKFIQLLPDLRYIQEDVLAPIYGDDFIEYLAAYPLPSNIQHDKHVSRIIHSLRKIMARYLETRLLKPTDARHETAYNEAIKLTSRLNDYLQVNQPSFSEELSEAFKSSPLYVNPSEIQPTKPRFENNAKNSVLFVTPGLI